MSSYHTVTDLSLTVPYRDEPSAPPVAGIEYSDVPYAALLGVPEITGVMHERESLWPTAMYTTFPGPSIFPTVQYGVEMAEEVVESTTASLTALLQQASSGRSVAKTYDTKVRTGTLTTVRDLAEIALGASLNSFSCRIGCSGVSFRVGCGNLTVSTFDEVKTAASGHLRLSVWNEDLRLRPLGFELTTNGPATMAYVSMDLGFLSDRSQYLRSPGWN